MSATLRKVSSVFIILILLLGSRTKAAYIPVTTPNFRIIVNNIEIDNGARTHPFLFHNNVLYFPLTYDNAASMGLDILWDQEKGLRVFRVTRRDGQIPFPNKASESTSEGYALAQVATDVSINGSQVTSDPDFPFLIYNDITYMPLTWKYVNDEFNWDMTFDQRVFSLSMTESNYAGSPEYHPQYWLRAAGHNGDTYFCQIDDGTHSTIYCVQEGITTPLFSEPSNLRFHGEFIPWGKHTLLQQISHWHFSQSIGLIRDDNTYIPFFLPSSVWLLTNDRAIVFMNPSSNTEESNLYQRFPDGDLESICKRELVFYNEFCTTEGIVHDDWLYTLAFDKNSPELESSFIDGSLHRKNGNTYSPLDGWYRLSLINHEIEHLQSFEAYGPDRWDYLIQDDRVDIFLKD